MPFPPAFIDEVIARNPIEDVVGQYVTLKRSGSNLFGLCPFHGEKTPSFSVTPDKGMFYCFGCHKGGGVINFEMEIEGLSYGDAVRALAKRAGLEVPEDEQYQSRYRQQERLWALHKEAARFFHSCLYAPMGASALEYARGRGMSQTTLTKFGIGYAPDSWSDLVDAMRKKGYTDQELRDSGLVTVSKKNGNLFDRFRDRLMFPINNVYGECVAFSGRILRPQENVGKYVNSPETAIFKKGDVVFALDKARGPMGKSGKALLCEGQIDVIACHEAGISFAVAPLGTAFTPEHARILSRYASRIVLCFDADKAGMVAADRAFRELAPFGKDIYLVNLPAGDDPDSFMKREGKEAFSGMVERAHSFFEVRIERARESGLLDDAASSAAFAREMTALLACMSDPVARDLATADVATRMRMAADNLRGAVRMAGRRKGQEQAQSAERKTAEEVPQHPPVKMDRAVAVLC